MSYDPLGGFNPTAPLLPDALEAAKSFKASLPSIPKGLLTRIYLHWAAEPFGCLDCAYNAEIDLEGGKWVMKLTHDPRDNAPGLDDNAEAAHTWHRNTGGFGIAITGMDGATTTNFGLDGVQLHELEHLCALAAQVGITYGIDTSGIVSPPGSNHTDNDGKVVNTTGEHNIETHATCAIYDNYRDERWDLGCLHALPPGVALTDAMRVASATALRQRIHLYAAALRAL